MITQPAVSSLRPAQHWADLAVDYRRYVEELNVQQQSRRLRLVGLDCFLSRFADIEAWMQRPTAARLDDARRTDAWAFLSWCFAATVSVLRGSLTAEMSATP